MLQWGATKIYHLTYTPRQRFEVIRVVVVDVVFFFYTHTNSTTFFDVRPCSSVEVYRNKIKITSSVSLPLINFIENRSVAPEVKRVDGWTDA
jgi:hypothetical protein